MRDRKKRNIIIGSLCCLLVFMGIGYAILSQTLNISGIANMKGDWNVRITNMELISTTGMAKELEKSFTDTTATFKGEMYIPGDSAEYKITVTNAGNIDAKLASVSQSIENEVSDIKFTNTALEGRILKAGETYEFNVKAYFDENATSIPDKSNIPTYTITLQYVQYDRDKVYNVSTNPTSEDCFTISDDGVITSYDYTCGTDVVIPDNVNNITVKSIKSSVFEVTNYGDNNVYYYSSSNDSEMYVFKNQEALDMFIRYLALEGNTKEGYKKNVEATLKEQNKTLEDWLKEREKEYSQTFSTIDQVIEYLINESKREIIQNPNIYSLKDNADLSGKTLLALFKLAVSEDGLTYTFSQKEATDAISSPITSLDLSKTAHLESANIFYNMENIKKINLGSKPFTYSNYLNEKKGDTANTILDELIVTSEVYNEISKSSSNSSLFSKTTITKLIILNGVDTHELNVSNLFDETSTNIKEISLEDGITKIGNKAFEGLHLEKISFPNSLISIGKRALANNPTLTNAGLGKLPKLLNELSSDAFMGDTSLTKIILTSDTDIDGFENGTQIKIGTNNDTYAPIYVIVEYER